MGSKIFAEMHHLRATRRVPVGIWECRSKSAHVQVIMSGAFAAYDSMDRLVRLLTCVCAFQPRLAARGIIGSSAEFPRAAAGKTSV